MQPNQGNKYEIVNCTVPYTLALNIDDGPNQMTEKHIDFFDRKNITVSFFFIANRLRNQTALNIPKKALKAGHQI